VTDEISVTSKVISRYNCRKQHDSQTFVECRPNVMRWQWVA